MKLPFLSFLKKKTPKEYFLALLLQDEIFRAIVFDQTNGVMHVVGEGQQAIATPLDTLPFEEMLTAADKAISIAENALPQNVQSHKTIFGVKAEWTENLQIKKEHLLTLKKICDELDLQPIGFLVFAEAVAHLLQNEEGAPISAVLIEIGTHRLHATLLRSGRVIASKETGITEHIPTAVDTLLQQFADAEILPSRIIVIDSEKRAHIAQELTSHSWSKSLPFLHVPQVTMLPDGFETQAILYGTATQMGFEMLGLPEIPQMKAQEANSEPQEVPEQGKEEQPYEEQNVQQTSENNTPENFGFVKDGDVLTSAPKKPIAFDNLKTPEGETPEEFADETFADIPEEVKEEAEKSPLPGLGASAVMLTEGMKKVTKQLKNLHLAALFGNMQKPEQRETLTKQDQETKSFKKIMLLIPVILIVCLAGLLWYIFGLKATATLIVSPKNVQATQGITFDSTSGTDVTRDTIGAQVVPITENGSVSVNATGSQAVGNKSQGTVTIYNNDDTSHDIPAGTMLTSPNGLHFTTNNDITVASASGDVFSGTKPGTENVDVTASDIGTDYNLPSGTKFSLANSTTIAAMNNNAFSGGTKKTVTVVSQKDLDNLTNNLTETLGNKAKQDITSSAKGGASVLPIFLSTKMSNQQFSHKAGDQASSVSLSATITYAALSYQAADLQQVGLAVIQSNNSNENISSDNVHVSVQNPKVSSDGTAINATLAVKAGLLPKIDTSQIATQLAGKPFAQAASILSNIPQLTSVAGELSPNLFFLPKVYPRIASHITVGIKANE